MSEQFENFVTKMLEEKGVLRVLLVPVSAFTALAGLLGISVSGDVAVLVAFVGLFVTAVVLILHLKSARAKAVDDNVELRHRETELLEQHAIQGQTLTQYGLLIRSEVELDFHIDHFVENIVILPNGNVHHDRDVVLRVGNKPLPLIWSNLVCDRRGPCTAPEETDVRILTSTSDGLTKGPRIPSTSLYEASDRRSSLLGHLEQPLPPGSQAAYRFSWRWERFSALVLDGAENFYATLSRPCNHFRFRITIAPGALPVGTELSTVDLATGAAIPCEFRSDGETFVEWEKQSPEVHMVGFRLGAEN